MMDLVGQALGQYRIEGLLGGGGMGQVYRGVHLYLNRPAAIKVMQAHLASHPDFQSRFLQEARASAALSHPNIVEIYEFNQHNDLLYLVMELMTNGSLRNVLRNNRGRLLPLAAGLDLIRQAANGLAAAGALNMVHRDIKPDNLLLNPSNGVKQGEAQYQLKISDFGLARLAQGGVLTNIGMPMGTLAYMSPEQCQSEPLDGRSDLYSLGVVLYEVITGYQPFQIKDFQDAMEKHVNAPPPPPTQIRPDLPAEVTEIVLRCLAKRPEERYATGADLAQALQTAIENIAAQPATSLYPPVEQLTPTKDTMLESPASRNILPPVVDSLITQSVMPKVRVLDFAGQTLQTVELRRQGLVIGRQSGCDIVLPSSSVSRSHLEVIWDGKQVSVKDLGSNNGTVLGDVQLLPQVSRVWVKGQLIHVGPFWLRLEGHGLSEGHATLSGLSVTTGTPTSSTMERSGRIGMVVNPRRLTITPGQPATIQVMLTNLGTIVDWFTLTVEGVPSEWMLEAGQEVQLNPGMQESIVLDVHVARLATNLAQEYPVTIHAYSREKPSESGKISMCWNVLPFNEDALRLEPYRASGRGKVCYALALQNSGNTPVRYELQGEDDERNMEYQFATNPIDLEPGQEVRVPLTMRAQRRWIGSEQRRPFQIQVCPSEKRTSQRVPGEFVNKTLIPTWVLPAVAFMLVAGMSLVTFFGLLTQAHPSPPSRPKTGTVSVPTVPTSQSDPTAAVTRNGEKVLTDVVSPTSQSDPTAAATRNGGNASTHVVSPPPQLDPTAIGPGNGGNASTHVVSPPPKGSPINPFIPTPIPSPQLPLENKKVLASGIGLAEDGQYVAALDRLYFVEYAGRLSVIDNVSKNPTYATIGRDYNELYSLYVTKDGMTAYLSKGSGEIVRVSLDNPNSSQATPIASGLTAPRQIVVDEAQGFLYTVEYTNPGRLIRINLKNGSQTTLLDHLQNPIGLQMTNGFHTAYISEVLQNDGSRQGQLVRYNLSTKAYKVLLTTPTGSGYLLYLHWTDDQQKALLATQYHPAKTVWYVDITKNSPKLQRVEAVAADPASAIRMSSNSLSPILVCTEKEIDEIS